MAATKHTAEEKRAIDRAWSALVRLVEANSTADRMVEEGYKLERRERSNMHAARALMVEAASDDWNARAEGLFRLAPGCRMAAMAAAEGRRIAKAYDRMEHWRRFKRLARASREAHWSAVERALDAIRRGS